MPRSARSPQIRRLEAGWLISVAADWAFPVVALVVAYQLGGAGAVGRFGLVRMLPSIDFVAAVSGSASSATG